MQLSKPHSVLIAFTVFWGALLLFQIQPIAGRFILPWFGSTAGVWAISLMFFQVVLLLGYTYSHVLSSRCSWSLQAKIHLSLLVLSVLVLPITPSEALKPDDSNNPSLRVLLILSMSVGVPYALLAATAPLLQRWFSVLYPSGATYRLYALSNAGSLIGLLSYPLLVEPFLSTTSQTLLWSGFYFAFVVSCGVIAAILLKNSNKLLSHESTVPVSVEKGDKPALPDLAFWLALSAIASGLLLAITNHITTDVAITPFLWILPLTLYLLSFIITFDSDRWYKRSVFLPMLLVVFILAARLALYAKGMGFQLQLIGYCVVLFYTCICCHGEIARSKPHPRYLTAFFLCISLGGAAGGTFVAVIAPLIFSSFIETPLLLMSAYAIIFGKVLKTSLPSFSPDQWKSNIKTISLVAAGIAITICCFAVTLLFTLILDVNVAIAYGFLVLALFFMGVAVFRAYHTTGYPKSFNVWRQQFRGQLILSTYLAGTACFLALSGTFLLAALGEQNNNVKTDRNFYGHTAIKSESYNEYGDARLLMHGRILHGLQLDNHPTWPVGYYFPSGGIGMAIKNHPKNLSGESLKVGVVGLGIGTIAAFANSVVDVGENSEVFFTFPSNSTKSDDYVFYELNPTVIDWALSEFSYLTDAKSRGASIEIIEGDARLSLEGQLINGSQNFDVLVLDAFSSDAIPIHLMTLEAFQLYLNHMSVDGVLVVHISNRHVNLEPILSSLSDTLQLHSRVVEDGENLSDIKSGTTVVLMSARSDLLDSVATSGRSIRGMGPLWTDSKHSLINAMKR